MKLRNWSLVKMLAVSTIIIVVGTTLVSWVLAGYLSRSANRIIAQPNIPYPYESIEISKAQGTTLKAWLFLSSETAPIVLVLHGVRGSRKTMESRAALLRSHGYSVLLLDLQAHGESQGNYISFGFLESNDVRRAVHYLKQRFPNNKLAALGVSLGGAACLVGKQPLQVDALVLEAVFSNISNAIKNRIEIKLGRYVRWLSFLMTVQLRLRYGIDPNKLSPVSEISKYHGPVLLIAGELDQHTKLEESKRIYNNANEPKQLWVVKNAAHVDYYQYDKLMYKKVVIEFLHKHLKLSD